MYKIVFKCREREGISRIVTCTDRQNPKIVYNIFFHDFFYDFLDIIGIYNSAIFSWKLDFLFKIFHRAKIFRKGKWRSTSWFLTFSWWILTFESLFILWYFVGKKNDFDQFLPLLVVRSIWLKILYLRYLYESFYGSVSKTNILNFKFWHTNFHFKTCQNKSKKLILQNYFFLFLRI